MHEVRELWIVRREGDEMKDVRYGEGKRGSCGGRECSEMCEG